MFGRHDRSGLTVTLFYNRAMMLLCVHRVVWHCLTEINKVFPVRSLSVWHLLQKLYIVFNINGPFTDVEYTRALCTTATPLNHRRQDCALIACQVLPLFFNMKSSVSMICKMNSKFRLASPQSFQVKFSTSSEKCRCVSVLVFGLVPCMQDFLHNILCIDYTWGTASCKRKDWVG